MPDVKYNLIRETLAPMLVDELFIEDESCYAQLDDIAAEDIVLVETKDADTIHEIAVRGLRHTGEIPEAVNFDADKVRLRRAVAYTQVMMPKLIEDLSTLEEGKVYFVKPLILEDSLGIDEHSLCRTPDEVKARVRYIKETFDKPSIVEEYIDGYDVTVGAIRVVNGYSMSAVRIDSTLEGVPFQSERVKVEDHRKFTDMRRLDGVLDSVLKQATLQTMSAIGAVNYGRLDFRVTEDGQVYLIEVNLYPGLKDTGAMYRAFKLVGYEYKRFLYTVLNTARFKLI